MNRVFSGTQPTGALHLGNYCGALIQWLQLQHTHECFFCIVDLHALTVPQNPDELRISILETAMIYLACGIDPKKCTIFPQSWVLEHTQLAWFFNCLTPLGWLQRMTQFKEKSKSDKEGSNLGLLAYPVLMAADILLYKATHVPVGDDQKQHLELARDIVGAFHAHFGHEYFTLPMPLISGGAPRVMSLRDGTSKMSKSDPSDFSRIHLLDDPDTIALKVRKAKTDSSPIPETPLNLKARPEALNLVQILATLQNKDLQNVCQEYAGSNFSSFKKVLIQCLVEVLEPIRQKYFDLAQDPNVVYEVLQKGSDQAREQAKVTIRDIKQIIGLI